MTDKNVSLVFDAAKELGAELSAVSWNGFNLFGDRKSIDELKRLMHTEARVDALVSRLKEYEARELARSWENSVDRQSGAFDNSEAIDRGWV